MYLICKKYANGIHIYVTSSSITQSTVKQIGDGKFEYSNNHIKSCKKCLRNTIKRSMSIYILTIRFCVAFALFVLRIFDENIYESVFFFRFKELELDELYVDEDCRILIYCL